jgi:hypothetical protein
MPLLNAVAREATRGALLKRSPTKAAAFTWAPRMLSYPHPYLQAKSLLGGVLAAFIFAALMFGFVTQVRGAGWGGVALGCHTAASVKASSTSDSITHMLFHPNPPRPKQKMTNLVSEREAGLRTALKNMGMMDSSYWASWMAFDALLSLVGALLILVFGERRLDSCLSARACGGFGFGWGRC